MISWVEQRFIRWGEWLQYGRGVAQVSPLANLERVRGSVDSMVVPIGDIESSRTHDWVCSLNSDEANMLALLYCTSSTSRECAAKLNMSLRTMYARLHLLQCAYAKHSDKQRSCDTSRNV